MYINNFENVEDFKNKKNLNTLDCPRVFTKVTQVSKVNYPII